MIKRRCRQGLGKSLISGRRTIDVIGCSRRTTQRRMRIKLPRISLAVCFGSLIRQITPQHVCSNRNPREPRMACISEDTCSAFACAACSESCIFPRSSNSTLNCVSVFSTESSRRLIAMASDLICSRAGSNSSSSVWVRCISVRTRSSIQLKLVIIGLEVVVEFKAQRD